MGGFKNIGKAFGAMVEESYADIPGGSAALKEGGIPAAIKMSALHRKRKKPEGMIDYERLSESLKQQQGITGKALSPRAMEAMLAGGVRAQIDPMIAREEKEIARQHQLSLRALEEKRLEKEAEEGGVAAGVIGGATLGAEVGGVGGVATGVWGAVIGGVLGGASAASIICDELNRQGLLDSKIIKRATYYRKKYMDKEMYLGYLIWATPVVKLMQKSSLATKLVKSFWIPLTYELAARSENKKGNVVGKIALKILVPFSKIVYKMKAKEICYG